MNDEAKASLEAALPAYEIAEKLGQGAFGVVYEARHTQLGRQVAIKQLPKMFAEDDQVHGRFIAEARMVASLDHPHIVPVYDFVESEGSRFLIMERCQGSVGERFKNEGIVTDEACAAVLACLAALDFAHEKGLLHRDVKPENLMYDAKGVVKLADFGIARDLGTETRRTATGVIVGTPAYMSPEQCRGDDLTPASDVYSVAMMAYELLTGGLPFPDTGSVNGLLAHHLVTPPAPLLQTRPELPGALGEVIDRALAKDLNVRYSTALEFATALARACVTAFGSGWLRRRRFILHWPEIIAETERPGSNSPRTGTIMVRPGDLPHVVTRADVDQAEASTADARPGDTSAQPVAVVGAPGDLATLPYDAAAPPTLPPSSPAAPATVSFGATAPSPAAPPAAPVPAAGARTGGPNWLLIGGAIAAVIAVIVGFIVLSGGDSGSDVTVTDPPAATAVPAETPTTEFVVLLTERPPGLDMTVADSPFTPTPCPDDQERVACIFGGIAVDQTSGEMTVPYFVEGFVPELEPAGYHLHFYLDTVVDGDETKAGTETPGGTWKVWDAPYPATSFGGENGRSLYTLSDYIDTDARNLCVLVADAEQRAIPGSGNCAPLIRLGDGEALQRQVNRLTGTYIGSCGIGATLIVPERWRWVDLVATPVDEAARIIRPAAANEIEPILQELVDAGGIIWADGAVIDGFVVNLSVSKYPGAFALTDTPAEVAATLRGLGINLANSTTRDIGGREVVYGTDSNRAGTRSATYVVPDYGYALAITFTAPPAESRVDTADAIAATMMGC